ncbi:MAG: enoyl-CoA hydratase/isomerase family protein, partial [Clostridia bacterium]|nr:enoyl-CoA hydratase/isomerase family protein [Clostridia bacterium]
MAAVEWQTEGPIGIATLNEPERMNALSRSIREGLAAVWDEFERRDDLRVLIMTGSGRAFCAGGDLADMPRSVPEAKRFLRDVINWLARPEQLSKPVIAAVNGYALGGGCELAIASDLVVASEKAEFGVPEALVGLVPGFAILRLHRIVGPALAKELAFTGRRLKAEEAQRLGLVNRVVPHDRLLDEARGLAHEILRAAPLSVELAKSAFNRELGGPDITYAIDGMAHIFATEDLGEG